MEKQTRYFVSRKNLLTWLSAILLVCSVACRIAYFCEVKGADASTVWFQLIMPVAACLLYCLIMLVSGKEHFYRTTVPFALICAFCAIRLGRHLGYAWLRVIGWVAMIAILVIYNVTVCGKIRHNWLLVLILVAVCGTVVFYDQALVRSQSELLLFGIANISMTAGVLLAVLAMRPHLDSSYHPTWGDRSDGRRIRTIPPITYVTPYIMPNRNGASNSIRGSVEISAIERYIHEKRREGLTNFGITHVFIAAYVRCVSQYPALNRFLSGQHIYTRDEDIQFSMIIKKEMTTAAPDTAIKLHLNPADTAYDVYKKFDKAVEEVKDAPLDSDFDKTAHALTLLPGVLLKFAVWILKVMDYFGLLPGFLLEISPFHGSVFFTSMGSLGIPPVIHHLYDFGNLPAFCAFGCKRHERILDDDGKIVRKKYVDYTFNLDERTVDGFYYATVLKLFHRLMLHPERLDTPPETVIRDID